MEIFGSATQNVVSGDDWIAFVSHDENDGGWQFLNSSPGRRTTLARAWSELDRLARSTRDLLNITHEIVEPVPACYNR
jgi:hypothetical protein